jgi:hypothetical protein
MTDVTNVCASPLSSCLATSSWRWPPDCRPQCPSVRRKLGRGAKISSPSRIYKPASGHRIQVHGTAILHSGTISNLFPARTSIRDPSGNHLSDLNSDGIHSKVTAMSSGCPLQQQQRRRRRYLLHPSWATTDVSLSYFWVPPPRNRWRKPLFSHSLHSTVGRPPPLSLHSLPRPLVDTPQIGSFTPIVLSGCCGSSFWG